MLLSQVHRLRALDLLGKFLDLGSWAVNLVSYRNPRTFYRNYELCAHVVVYIVHAVKILLERTSFLCTYLD